MRRRTASLLLPVISLLGLLAYAAAAGEGEGEPLFQPSTKCVVCHDGLSLVDGTDISIGRTWSASMMANSARDPYWQAGVRREVTDHPEAAAAIETECSRCHMPMSHHVELARGTPTGVLVHLPVGRAGDPLGDLAADGVSCTVCHQVEPANFGRPESFSGHFEVAPMAAGPRQAYGPIAPDPGLTKIMQSATGYRQAEAEHISRSESCASCHTLFTHAVGVPDAEPLPEQVPYLEWLNSDYRDVMSCQDCHMPEVEEKTRVASVLGRDHPQFSRHLFRGGNFLIPQLFRRHLQALEVTASRTSLERAEASTREHLETETAALSVDRVEVGMQSVKVHLSVINKAGHKLPTAYPSRRAWLHFTATAADGRVLFESGTLQADGAIAGNDNDAAPLAYEPHHECITASDQVQIYEAIMGDSKGLVTTGLLKATHYLKDNRLLPDGFDKGDAPSEVAVRGRALQDDDFQAGGDTVCYEFSLANATELTVTVRLLYQPIGFRWASNLADTDAHETRRFVRLFADVAGSSAVVLASAETAIRADSPGQAGSPEQP